MTNRLEIFESIKTLYVEIEKDVRDERVEFKFLIDFLRSTEGRHKALVSRMETREMKTLSGETAHEDIFVVDIALASEQHFLTLVDAERHILDRLNELFG